MADIYVNHTGSNTAPYDTEAKASTDIQVALDIAVAFDTVWIKADSDYVMDGIDQQAAVFDIDVADSVSIKGYYSSTGDQDYGGAKYKHATDGWVVIDANNGAYSVFSTGDYEKLRFENIKTINVATTVAAFDITPTAIQFYNFFQNCWFTGSRYAINCKYQLNPIIRDCKFTGTYSPPIYATLQFDTTNTAGAIIESNIFDIVNAAKIINVANAGMSVIYNNIFIVSGNNTTHGISCGAGALVFNNVFYNNGGTVAKAINTTTKGIEIFNNIIVGCTVSINDVLGIHFGGWNCLYNNGADWTLREGDITTDPQFVDAANGDFRLKATSPCLNTGISPLQDDDGDGLNLGFINIGTWQRKSFLGVD